MVHVPKHGRSSYHRKDGTYVSGTTVDSYDRKKRPKGKKIKRRKAIRPEIVLYQDEFGRLQSKRSWK